MPPRTRLIKVEILGAGQTYHFGDRSLCKGRCGFGAGPARDFDYTILGIISALRYFMLLYQRRRHRSINLRRGQPIQHDLGAHVPGASASGVPHLARITAPVIPFL